MNQLVLNFEPPRASRRPTSSAAAEVIKPDCARLRNMVLGAIVAHGVIGATDEEIQLELGLAGDTERPRRRELEKAHLVVDSGQRRPTSSGRMAIVWRAVGRETTR